MAMQHTRRDLLKSAAALMALGLSPAWAARAAGRKLVILELKGGCDSLNAFPPYTDPLYYQARSRIAIPRSEVIAISPTLGFHPSLAPLVPVWEAGEMALVQGVGYADPVLSHFESGRIWETGSMSPDDQTGWLSGPLAAENAHSSPGAVVFGFNAGPLRNLTEGVLQLSSLEGMQAMQPIGADQPAGASPALQHIGATLRQQGSAARFKPMLERLAPPLDIANDHLFGGSLRSTAAMIATPSSPAIYKLILGGFDTHVGQPRQQAKVLRELAAGLAYLRQSLKSLGAWNDVLIVTYTEFGRRVQDNANNGTDHGTAQVQMLMGPGLRPGLHGTPSRLDDLVEGNLRSHVDFRQVFNTAASWMNWPELFAQFKPGDLKLLRA